VGESATSRALSLVPCPSQFVVALSARVQQVYSLDALYKRMRLSTLPTDEKAAVREQWKAGSA
jgi:hypothetical protein